MKIDLNCDMGEGMNNEALLIPYISSCNIACGAHAGSVDVIDKVIKLAKQHHVKIGAHPSYPDRENFGRKTMDISNTELQKSLENQIQLLKERTTLQNVALHHIKLHGALYNITSVNKEIAQIVLNALQNTIKDIIIYAPFNSVFANLCEDVGYNILYEGFADRNYNDDKSLVARQSLNAIITQKEEVLMHVLKMFKKQRIISITGKEIRIKADTFCIHGDHQNSIEIVQYLYDQLKKLDIEIF